MFPNIWAQRFQQMPMGQFPQRPVTPPQAPMQPQPAPWGGQMPMQPMLNRWAGPPMGGQTQLPPQQMPMQAQPPMPMQQPMQQFPNAYAGFRPNRMAM